MCEHWSAYRGTPVRLWFDAQLADIFGIDVRPSAEHRRRTSMTRSPSGSPGRSSVPRALWDRFGISVLATTDDPCDDLSAHQRLQDDPSWNGRVIPTFRPDRYLEPLRPTWNSDVDRLAEAAEHRDR